MEAIKYILSLAFGICVLLFVKYIMSFITGGISKAFGTTTTLNGKIVATPDTLDNNIKELKELKDNFLISYRKHKSKFQTKPNLDMDEMLRLLSELDKLKERNVIDENEYQELKRKIINPNTN